MKKYRDMATPLRIALLLFFSVAVAVASAEDGCQAKDQVSMALHAFSSEGWQGRAVWKVYGRLIEISWKSSRGLP